VAILNPAFLYKSAGVSVNLNEIVLTKEDYQKLRNF
jgi:hypothetical protein